MKEQRSVNDAELLELASKWRTRANRHDDYRGISGCRMDLEKLLTDAQTRAEAESRKPVAVAAAVKTAPKQETK